MKFAKSALTTACIAAAILLSGCLVPEKFTATVDMHPDASYEYRYTGTAVHAMAAAAIKKAGSLQAKDEAGLKAEADKMAKVADVRRAAYLGNGRYDLKIEGGKKAGEALRLLDFLTVSRDKDGIITISSPELKEKDRQGLAELGIKIDGALAIRLPKNAEVISQNATSTPSLFGLVGAYSWKIGGTDQRPIMKIRFKT